MKYLKAVLIAIVTICTFSASQAQVRVQIGGHPHRYHRRVVVVRHQHYRHHRPYRRRHY